jgi:FAD/FMN-containing dehydrogenase
VRDLVCAPVKDTTTATRQARQEYLIEVIIYYHIDSSHPDRVLEVDTTSRAARIQGGIRGPAIEAALKPHGLAIRHYPQSFEFSTLGGWIATRSGGHFATLYTHIDDFVESLRAITPAGMMESRRLPGSGRLVEQWRLIKARASDALIAAGGTITHHHAVGRDHMPWYRAQRPDLFGKAFEAAKSALDPAGIMNPGVLVP